MTDDTLLQAMASVLEGRSACYLAGPITSVAPRDVRIPRRVEAENRAALRAVAKRLRSVLAVPVIDPGVLVVPSWLGEDYSRFFLSVIDMFAQEIRLMDGWEFSLGATKEFLFAYDKGIKCRNLEGVEISLDSGIHAISRAEAEYLDVGDTYRAGRLAARIAVLKGRSG